MSQCEYQPKREECCGGHCERGVGNTLGYIVVIGLTVLAAAALVVASVYYK